MNPSSTLITPERQGNKLVYVVPSDSKPGTSHKVIIDINCHVFCTCLGFFYKNGRDDLWLMDDATDPLPKCCKHVLRLGPSLVESAMQLRDTVVDEAMAEREASKAWVSR